jgi:ABC-type antimicrobial peptide transport system ATPase subunit
MKSITFIEQALAELDNDVQNTLLNIKLSLQEKDNIMLPLLQQKKVLQQTLEDLIYLKKHPPTPNQPCGISKYRKD